MISIVISLFCCLPLLVGFSHERFFFFQFQQVFLESVLLEIRSNDWKRAAMEAQAALKVHSGAGRLWAVLVQLKQRDSDEAQQASLKQVGGGS